MIKSFRCAETERIFQGQSSPKFPSTIQNVARRKLRQLDAATILPDLKVPPGNRLEALKDDRQGQYSIRVNDQYRICFEWSGSDAFGVELVDYH